MSIAADDMTCWTIVNGNGTLYDGSGRSCGRFCNVSGLESKSVAYCSCFGSISSQLKFRRNTYVTIRQSELFVFAVRSSQVSRECIAFGGNEKLTTRHNNINWCMSIQQSKIITENHFVCSCLPRFKCGNYC